MLWFAGGTASRVKAVFRETALTLDACLVQVTGTRRRDSAGTSFARVALLNLVDLVFSFGFLWVGEVMTVWLVEVMLFRFERKI